jgi:Leucine-rich repeat (LRR) protein
MAITVRLILNSHFPDKNGVWDDDDFESLDVIKLSGKKITAIDNLELFHHIKELHLGDNSISIIENISILPQVSRVTDLLYAWTPNI